MTYRLGVDVGGTFTDLVLVGPDGVARTCKVLSSAGNYADAIILGARELLRETGAAAGDIREIIHGTTVATNAILERRGAATGLITTEGFRDLLEIGRLRLARLYDLNFERPASSLAPRGARADELQGRGADPARSRQCACRPRSPSRGGCGVDRRVPAPRLGQRRARARGGRDRPPAGAGHRAHAFVRDPARDARVRAHEHGGDERLRDARHGPLGLSLEDAAYGVYLLGRAGMARAVRAVTIERGRDPRDFRLVAFGGNGPLFAAEMARSLEIGTILVPPAPGVFSAVGLLEAEVEHHLVRTFLRPLQTTPPAEIGAAVGALEREASALLRDEGHGGRSEIARSVDCKYQGQSFELTVPLPARLGDSLAKELTETFGREHEWTYGHRADDDPIQLVNLRLTARLVRPAAPPMRLGDDHPGARGERRAFFGGTHGTLATPVIARSDLHGTWRPGPLLVDEYDATTLVPPGCAARRDEHDNIVIRTAE